MQLKLNPIIAKIKYHKISLVKLKKCCIDNTQLIMMNNGYSLFVN